MGQRSCVEISLRTEKDATATYRALRKDPHTVYPESHMISVGTSLW